MKKFSFVFLLLLTSFLVGAQCLTATNGQWPSTTFTPTCGGTSETVTTAGYGGEYSKVNVTSGVTYNFTSSVATDYITISNEAGTTAYAFGTASVVWTSTITGVIRFYTHTNSACGDASVNRTRAMQCPFSPCAAPTAQPTGLTLTPGLTSISGSFTTATPAPTNYLVVRYTAGGGSNPALPANNSTYFAGNTITGTGLSTGTVVSAGATITFSATGLTANTTYDFIVFSYNSGSCAPVYLTTATVGQNRMSATTTACSAITSPITVGATGNYTSLTSLATVLGGCPITTPISVEIQSNYTSTGETFPVTFTAIAGASATNTVTIKPATGVTATITGSAPNVPLLKIQSNYVVIDGSNNGSASRNLTISNTSTTAPNVAVIGSVGTTPVTNVIVRNTNLVNGVNTSSALIISDATTVANPGYFNNITIQNNSIQKAYIGIYSYATVAAGNGSGLLITGNDLSATGANAIRISGIYVQGADGATVSNNIVGNFDGTSDEVDRGIWFATGTVNSIISGNTVTGLAYTGTGAYAPIGLSVSSGATAANIQITGNTVSGISSAGAAIGAGIYLQSATAAVTIEKNKVSNIKNSVTGGAAYGIRLSSTATSGTNNISNNFIFDVASNGSATAGNNGHGIAITSGLGYNVYYNTVNLNSDQTATTGVPAAFYVGSGVTGAGAVNAVNNIFINSGTVGTNRYAIYSGAANTVFGTINYNDYFTAGPNLGFIGSARADLAAVQAGFGGNANSKNILPVFTSATDLHLPAASNASLADGGMPITSITTDIDNQTRSTTTPDMGADEFDVALPVTLVTFKGERKATTNLLSWTTATELNNNGFELQRSANGKDFSKLIFVATKATNGNSTSTIDYDFTDAKPLAGTNYYQLKQIDKDGKATYSNIVAIKGAIVSQLLFSNLYPNPAKKGITATIDVPANTKVTLLITSVDGKIVVSKTASLISGTNQVSLDVSSLSKGNYTMKVICAEGCENNVKMFVKE